eukprot:403341472
MVESQHDVDYADPDQTTHNQTELPEVKKNTGEELEECIFKMRSKLYRKRDEQLKERGTGNCKLLRNKETKKIRFVMRQEKTLKPVANFILQESPLCELMPMKNSDKAFIWSCNDCSEEVKLELLAIKLQTVENALKFKEAFEAAQKYNVLLKEGKLEELVHAPAIEDVEEKPDPADDPDQNKTAGGEEDGANAGGDDE